MSNTESNSIDAKKRYQTERKSEIHFDSKPRPNLGKEKIIGLASIDLEKLEAKQFNFSNDLLEAHLSGGRVGSLDVSMWKYVKPPGFKATFGRTLQFSIC